jgi:Concanavalin A-like lectin/glucanases superfamily
MKKLFYLLFCLIYGLKVNAQTTYPSGVSGCIARWTFDTTENVTQLTSLPDVSGNNNLGTAYSITSVKGFRNKPNKAGGFNGSSSWSEVMHKSMLNPVHISTIALVKFKGFYTGTCQGNDIVYKGYDYINDCSWAMCTGEIDNDCSAVNSGTQKLLFFNQNIPSYIPPANNYVDTGKWYFLATVYNGSKIDYFQIVMDTSNHVANINPLYTNSNVTPLGNTIHNVYIGVTQNPPYKYWLNADLDEVILFNKALTNSEIQGVYDYLWGFTTGINQMQLPEESVGIVKVGSNLIFDYKQKIPTRLEVMDVSGNRLYAESNPKGSIEVGAYGKQILLVKIVFANGQYTVIKIPN